MDIDPPDTVHHQESIDHIITEDFIIEFMEEDQQDSAPNEISADFIEDLIDGVFDDTPVSGLGSFVETSNPPDVSLDVSVPEPRSLPAVDQEPLPFTLYVN